MTKVFKEIRVYDSGKVEVKDTPALNWNMSVNRCVGSYYFTQCREQDIKKATDKLYNHLRKDIEQEQKALDKRKRTIAKLNHPHILKLTNSELKIDTRK